LGWQGPSWGTVPGNESETEDQQYPSFEVPGILSFQAFPSTVFLLLDPGVFVHVPPGLILKYSVFCPHSLFVFCTVHRTNSDYFPI